MGTAETDRQPSAGVFEELSAIAKPTANDVIALRASTTNITFMHNTMSTDLPSAQAASVSWNAYNTAIKIGNATYLRKTGTTDLIAVSGVQVDA